MGGLEPGNGEYCWPQAKERVIWVAASQGAGDLGCLTVPQNSALSASFAVDP